MFSYQQMTTSHVVLLLGAGVLAGLVGSAGGIGSLISYPALLAVGIPALPASVTNSVAFVTYWPGSALGSHPELRGQGRWLRRWMPVSAAGAAIGVMLLLLTPPGVFGQIVPFMVVFASLALLLQPRVSVSPGNRSKAESGFILPYGLFAVSVYNSYWGAGAGILTLVLLLLTVNEHFATSNALKNMLLGMSQGVCALGFIMFGPVHWDAVVPLAIGILVGSRFGPAVARRTPADVLRVIIALSGFLLAVHLWTIRA